MQRQKEQSQVNQKRKRLWGVTNMPKGIGYAGKKKVGKKDPMKHMMTFEQMQTEAKRRAKLKKKK
jgi:hypothetical protein